MLLKRPSWTASCWIVNFGRTQETDLKRFAKKVLQLFKWHELDDERTMYLAPYMPPDDSVERYMGRTKLLYDWKQEFANDEESPLLKQVKDNFLVVGKVHCEMALCYYQ